MYKRADCAEQAVRDVTTSQARHVLRNIDMFPIGVVGRDKIVGRALRHYEKRAKAQVEER